MDELGFRLLIEKFSVNGGSGSLQIHPTEASANTALVNRFVSAASAAIATRGAFSVGLSGGSMPASLAGLKTATVGAGACSFMHFPMRVANYRCADARIEELRLCFASDVGRAYERD